MGNVEAIKKYFSTDSRPVENREILELRKSCSKEEFNAIGEACCKALGEPYTPAN